MGGGGGFRAAHRSSNLKDNICLSERVDDASTWRTHRGTTGRRQGGRELRAVAASHAVDAGGVEAGRCCVKLVWPLVGVMRSAPAGDLWRLG